VADAFRVLHLDGSIYICVPKVSVLEDGTKTVVSWRVSGLRDGCSCSSNEPLVRRDQDRFIRTTCCGNVIGIEVP
jgi:hypothetical protein